MAKVKAILGTIWAALSIPILLAVFMGMPFWSEMLVTATGVEVSPWFTGGEVQRTVDRGAYRIDVHRPVFDALIGERKEGFVQLDWTPLEALPAHLEDEIDLDGDGQADLRAVLDKESPQVTLTQVEQGKGIVGVESVTVVGEALVVRVRLKNPAR